MFTTVTAVRQSSVPKLWQSLARAVANATPMSQPFWSIMLTKLVPPSTSSMTPHTASVESIAPISYTSTDVQYVYVTIEPPASLSYTSTDVQYVYVTVDPPAPSSSAQNISTSGVDVTSTKTVTAVHLSTTTTSVVTTLIITPSPTTTSTTASTSLSSSSTASSTTSSILSTSSSTTSTTQSTVSPTTTTTSTTLSSTSTEIESTSTVFSTVTVFVTVTPVYSTVFTTTTCSPGTYTIGQLTTTVSVEETIVVPCSTETIITMPWLTSFNAADVTSYVTATPTQDSPVMVITATVDQTAYTTVSCTPGTYTIDGVVTTVTEPTAIVMTATPSPVAKLRRREEVAWQFPVKSRGPWAITYAPYTVEGVCKTAEQVASDVRKIALKGFRAIRLYSTDCDSLTTIGGAAAAEGIKLILGISINKESGLTGSLEQVDAILDWPRNSWDVVDMVVVGNEAVFNGFVTAAELAAFLEQTRKTLRESGYVGPITTAETPTVIDKHHDVLCPAIDAVGVNVQPFFDASVKPQNAGNFVRKQIAIAEAACNFEVPVVILEAGWPSAASEVNGLAVAGRVEQELAIRSIRDATDARGNVVYFTFVDDEWKLPGAFGVEQRFGCVDLF
ncbi:glycoside hydrolase superfamily [Lipomyces kononenkoae]